MLASDRSSPLATAPDEFLRVDIAELRAPVLASLCRLSVLFAWLVVAILGAAYVDVPPLMSLLPLALVAAVAFACMVFDRVPLDVRIGIFLLALVIGFGLGCNRFLSVGWLYYQALIVSVAGLLAGTRAAITAAVALSVISALCIRAHGTPYTMLQLVGPYGLMWITTITSGIASRNLYTALGWAMDSQGRAWRTTHEVQQRRADLRRALHSLTATHQALELTSRELAQARREAEEARLAKSRFVANISHELRTPLNVVVGFAEMLCTSPESYGDATWTPALREDLLTIWRNAQHLLNMIDDVLDLSQIEAARLPIVPEPTDIVDFLHQALASASALLRDSGLDLRVDLPEISCTLQIDRTRIRQVLLNLINNAVRYTPSGFVELGLEIGDHEVMIYVRDSGVGIPPDKLEAIFEEFEQVDTSLRRTQGVGLGLAISRHFVRLHGGRIWAESRLGEGSIFRFTLPRSAVAADLAGASLQRTPSGPLVGRSETIVAHCHDELGVRLLARHLETCHVLATSSLSETVEAVRAHHPGLALIAADSADTLPKALADAETLLDAIAPYEVPVVACLLPTERRAGAQLGTAGFLIKPVTHTDVAVAVSQTCAHPKQVLVVDDEADMARLLARMIIEEWPTCEVLTAALGREALELARPGLDAILLDLLLPDINGVEVLATLRANPGTASIPVIAVTARGPAEDLAASQKGRFYVLRNGGLAAGELVRCLDMLTKTLPPRYIISRSRPDTREAARV